MQEQVAKTVTGSEALGEGREERTGEQLMRHTKTCSFVGRVPRQPSSRQARNAARHLLTHCNASTAMTDDPHMTFYSSITSSVNDGVDFAELALVLSAKRP